LHYQVIVSSPHYRSGTTQPSVACVAASLTEGTRRPECESYHSSLSIAELNAYNTAPPSPATHLCVWRDASSDTVALIDIRCGIDNQKEGFFFGLFYIGLPCFTIILE